MNKRRAQNIMLVKDDVGKAKPSTRPLPPAEHTFGLLVKRDEVGVKGCKYNFQSFFSQLISLCLVTVTSHWVTHKQSTKGGPLDHDFKKLNKIATKHRVTTCQGQYNMRKSVDVRLRDPRETIRHGKVAPNEMNEYLQDDFYFGKANRPSTPVKDVVNSLFGNQAELKQVQTNFINDAIQEEQRRMTGSRAHTRAS